MDVGSHEFSEEENEHGLTEDDIEDIGKDFKKRIHKGGGVFSETLDIGPGELFTWADEKNIPTIFSSFVAGGTERLFKAAKDINDKFPELEFKFEQDSERRQIKYTVTEVKGKTT